jgi:ribonuclease Z
MAFLGTGAAAPDKRTLNGNAATWLSYGRKCRILGDCGEGAKYQLLRAGLSQRIHHVFFTHEHYDHLMGLTGVLAMLSQVSGQKRSPAVHIYGPAEAIKRAESLVQLGRSKPGATLHLSITYRPLVLSDSVDLGPARVLAFRTKHDAWPSLGYAFEQSQAPPNRIVFLGDTRPLSGFAAIARGASCLVANTNFSGKHAGLAAMHGHMTVVEAAQLAKEAEVEYLLIQHISPRYSKAMEDRLVEA